MRYLLVARSGHPQLLIAIICNVRCIIQQVLLLTIIVRRQYRTMHNVYRHYIMNHAEQNAMSCYCWLYFQVSSYGYHFYFGALDRSKIFSFSSQIILNSVIRRFRCYQIAQARNFSHTACTMHNAHCTMHIDFGQHAIYHFLTPSSLWQGSLCPYISYHSQTLYIISPSHRASSGSPTQEGSRLLARDIIKTQPPECACRKLSVTCHSHFSYTQHVPPLTTSTCIEHKPLEAATKNESELIHA